MSFGEGNKRKRIAELELEVAQLKRALGDSQSANNRLKGENASLAERVDRLEVVNGELCAEINRQERVIETLRQEGKAYEEVRNERPVE